MKKRFTENDPENVRNAGIATLFMFNFWNATGLLPMMQAIERKNDEDENKTHQNEDRFDEEDADGSSGTW